MGGRLLGAFVLAGPWLNGWAQRHWQLFARHNHFDAGGRFFSLYLSAPMVVFTLCSTVRILWEVVQMLRVLFQAKAKLEAARKSQ